MPRVKRRREDVLPLYADLVPEVAAWVSGRLPDAALWPGDWAKHKHAGRLLLHDLENAGIAWQDAQGRFRMTSIRLGGAAEGGRPLAVAVPVTARR